MDGEDRDVVGVLLVRAAAVALGIIGAAATLGLAVRIFETLVSR